MLIQLQPEFARCLFDLFFVPVYGTCCDPKPSIFRVYSGDAHKKNAHLCSARLIWSRLVCLLKAHGAIFLFWDRLLEISGPKASNKNQ